MRLIHYLAVILIGFFIIPDSNMSSELQREFIEGTNKFASNLYQELRSEYGNIIVSPISIQILLALAQQGAKKHTATELAKVLHLPEDNGKVLESHKALITGLENPHLKIATKIFIEKSMEVFPDYQTLSKEYFLSEVENEDFKNNPEEARIKMNAWAAEKTNNKINELLEIGLIHSLTKLVLVNAVYFKSDWKIKFDKDLTELMPFYITPENITNVKMMVLRDQKFRYIHSKQLGAQIVEIPYSENAFSMVIILPNKLDGLREVEDNLLNLDLSEELLSLHETTLNLYLPKFKIEQSLELNKALEKMGMASAFVEAKADFSGISNIPLAIDQVIQKAFIEVNEEGTEAVAATAGVLRKRRAIISPPEVKCDHPFGFIIIHSSTGSVLFESRITSLSSEDHAKVHAEL